MALNGNAYRISEYIRPQDDRWDDGLNENSSGRSSLVRRAKDMFVAIRSIKNKEFQFNYIKSEIQRSRPIKNTIPAMAFKVSDFYKKIGIEVDERSYIESYYLGFKEEVNSMAKDELKVIEFAYFIKNAEYAECFQFKFGLYSLLYDEFKCGQEVFETIYLLNDAIESLKNKIDKIPVWWNLKRRLSHIGAARNYINKFYHEGNKIKEMADQYISLCNNEIDLRGRIKYESGCYGNNILVESSPVKNKAVCKLRKELNELQIKKKNLNQKIQTSIKNIRAAQASERYKEIMLIEQNAFLSMPRI